jgi:O-antigen/teichoic acid export membrane protein
MVNPGQTSESTMPRTGLRSRLLSGGIWVVAGKILGGPVVVVTNMLLARVLSPAELGAYFLAFSLVTVCATVAPLGANRAVVRFVAESIGLNRPAVARGAVRHAIMLGIGGSLVLASAIYSGLGERLARDVVNSQELADASDLVAAWIVPATMTLLIAEIFRGFHDLRWATLHGGLLGSLLTLLIVVTLHLNGIPMTLRVVVWVSFTATMLGALVAGFTLHRRVHKLPPPAADRSLLGMLRVSLPLCVTTAIVLLLQQADIWLVGAFESSQDVAIYGAAARLMFIVSVPLFMVNAVIQPMVAEYYSQRRLDELQKLMRVAATVAAMPALAALACAIVFAAPGLRLLYGETYMAGAGVLVVLALGQMVNVWTGSCGIFLMMTGHERTLMTLTALTGLLTVALMAALVGPFGILGVAIGSALGVSLQNAVLWFAAGRLTGVWTNMGFRGLGDVLRVGRAEVERRRRASGSAAEPRPPA